MRRIRALWLFLRIVLREDDGLTHHRMSPSTAWEVAKIVWLK